MTSLNISEENLLTNQFSSKGKIFIYNSIIYSLYSTFNQTIEIYDNQNNTSYTIYSQKNVEIYHIFLNNNRLWICGKNLDDNIGFYTYSDFSNGQFQQITVWYEAAGSEHIFRIFIIDNILHYIKTSFMNNQYEITMVGGPSDYLIYSDPYCSLRDVYYNGDLYFIIETIDDQNNLVYLKIFKQQNYSPSTGITNLSLTNISDHTLNVMFFDTCMISNVKYMVFGKSQTITNNNNTVVANQVSLYNLYTNSVSTTFTFPNIYFKSVSYIYYNGKYLIIGYLYQYSYTLLRYFAITSDMNGNVMNSTVYIKNSSYTYLLNDRNVDVVIKDNFYYTLSEIKNTSTQENTNVIQTKMFFQIQTNGSAGSDPHIYPLFSDKFDLLRMSTNRWYSLFEMDSIKMKVKFVGLKTGIFFHKILIHSVGRSPEVGLPQSRMGSAPDHSKIQNNNKEVKINFNKRTIKGNIQHTKGHLFMAYKDTRSLNSKRKFFSPKKMDIIHLYHLKYPMCLYIDFNTRYIHLYFEDKKPSKDECSGLIV